MIDRPYSQRLLREHGRAALRGACLVLLALAFAAPNSARGSRVQEFEGPQEEDDEIIHGFSIPNTRAARARINRAREHVGAERWNEAIEDLQILIESHGGDLIRFDPSVHHGVTAVATAELDAMPEEAIELYRRRFESKALVGLELARSRGDRGAVLEVARRWPLCESAPRAWWTVGDLELELGNLSEARAAWARALRWRLGDVGRAEPVGKPRLHPDIREDWQAALVELEQLGVALASGEQARVELAISTLHDESPLAEAAITRDAPRGSLRLPGPGEAPLGAPGESASSWPKPFRVPTPHPFDHSGYNNLFPVRVGDSVLLSNSLQLFAINAYSGALRWAGDKPRGWERLSDREAHEFFEGVSLRDAMIAPAASERVAVAALQVPVTDITNETFRNIAITTIIPDRRLHAYDIESGEELWNHAPPRGWDGESGSFTDRMSVAGPPVVAASRVLVPMHRMYGRIEFYVACMDLESGELLWSTQLVSGQRELNMFARAEAEFTAPPVRVEGDRVIALTQLGAIASLDLFSGAILWETLYDQIPPPQRNNFSAQRIRNDWRNSSPVVADGVVVAAPFDSRDLVGIDLESGIPLWTVQHDWIERLAGGRRADINVLVGADERTVYLGSWPVVALKAPGGLSVEAPRSLSWRFPADEIQSRESTTARPILLADRMVIPWSTERVEVELRGGRRRSKPVPWQSGRSGNLLAEGGSLYTLDTRTLDGYFEWDMLLERAEFAYQEAPGELEPTLYLASLLAQRGRSEAEAGRTESARDWLREAGDLLEGFFTEEGAPTVVEAEMHDILRSRARVYINLADGQRALRELRRAREYAAGISELRDTLIEEHELLLGLDIGAQREVLEQLEEHCSERALLTRLTLDTNRASGWRFVPLGVGEHDGFRATDLEIELWVTLERQELAASLQDTEEELAELHRMLEEWPDRLVRDLSLAEYSQARITELIELYGRGVYARFEAEARELLVEAQETHNDDLLVLVAEYYPHSLAAREANDQLLDWAAESGEIGEVARHALAELPASWAPERGTDRELQMLAHLGAALAAKDNFEAARSLFGTLAAIAPDLTSTAQRDLGKSFAVIADELGEAPLPELAKPAHFNADVLKESAVLGEYTYLGTIPPRAGSAREDDEVLLFAHDLNERGRSISLVAYSSASIAKLVPEIAWRTSIPLSDAPSSWKNAIRFAPGLVIASTEEEVYALDRDTGVWRWTCESLEGDVDSLQLADGLVFVTTQRLPGNVDLVTALDVVTGQELWSTEFERLFIDRRPACGDGRVVLLPRSSRSKGRVLDAFSGREVLSYELPESVTHASIAGAWVERGLLIVPWFQSGRNPARNRIVAVDLASGELVWNLSFDELLGGKRELRSIVQHDGHTYLRLQPQLGTQSDGIQGLIVELHVGLGATARVGNLQLGREDRLLGVGQDRRVQLDLPYLYVRSFVDGGGPLRLQQVQLPSGTVGWTQRLSLTREDLYNSQIRMPATSESAIALVISTKGDKRFDAIEAHLYFLDTLSGQPRGNQRLDAKLGTSVDISLHGLGESLLLAGKNLLEVMR